MMPMPFIRVAPPDDFQNIAPTTRPRAFIAALATSELTTVRGRDVDAFLTNVELLAMAGKAEYSTVCLATKVPSKL
ncbi:hypothetical protein CTheo_7145 [Ceratobasidium theobromae]|uniref:Uncharacterized protein n=1 Tax=Ceratobasidium theobromae TaxID=1582974 RepID=A0A5N5QCD0_9AGAM|nr:hypothetical protein CTheo_7145 [Ceratobasidium theobromae]